MFYAKVEALCAPHYATDNEPGRPSIAPGLYFRMLLKDGAPYVSQIAVRPALGDTHVAETPVGWKRLFS